MLPVLQTWVYINNQQERHSLIHQLVHEYVVGAQSTMVSKNWHNSRPQGTYSLVRETNLRNKHHTAVIVSALRKMPLVENLYQGQFGLVRRSEKASLMTALWWVIMQCPQAGELSRLRLHPGQASGRRTHSTYKELKEGHVIGVKKAEQKMVSGRAGEVNRAKICRAF